MKDNKCKVEFKCYYLLSSKKCCRYFLEYKLGRIKSCYYRQVDNCCTNKQAQQEAIEEMEK